MTYVDEFSELETNKMTEITIRKKEVLQLVDELKTCCHGYLYASDKSKRLTIDVQKYLQTSTKGIIVMSYNKTQNSNYGNNVCCVRKQWDTTTHLLDIVFVD